MDRGTRGGAFLIKVTCNVKFYEVQGTEEPPVGGRSLEVVSHWCYSDRVVLEISGNTYTVLGSELISAIRNAMNTERF